MNELKDIEPKGMEKKPLKEQLNNSINQSMRKVRIMGNLDAKETSEMVFAAAKLVSSGKLAKEDDGKITATDATHFIDDIFPLIDGIQGSNKIPAEFADGYDESDQAQINTAWREGAELHENDEIGVEKCLKVIYALNDLALHLNLIKPAPPEA